jgi:pSer/pThr/pTyr-binding forkhead associated (FHA) protein
MKIRLVPLEGGNPIDLSKDFILVGRKEDCDLRLDSKSVSKLHCVIVNSGNKIHIRDLGSTNGTRVNGMRIRRATLGENDNLSIANIPFKVSMKVSPNGGQAKNYGCTVQISANDIEDVIENQNSDSEKIIPRDAAHPNDLPDIYPTSH